MGFYAPAQLVQDARKHGVEVRPVDVNHCDYECTLEPTVNVWALRLGLRLVGGVRRADVDTLTPERLDSGPYTSVSQFANRTGLSRSAVELLSDADAFGSLQLDRRAALWHSLAQDAAPCRASLLAVVAVEDAAVGLPPLPAFDQVARFPVSGYSIPGSMHSGPSCRELLTNMLTGSTVIASFGRG